MTNAINEIVNELTDNRDFATVDGYDRIGAGDTPWMNEGSEELWIESFPTDEPRVLRFFFNAAHGWTGEEVSAIDFVLEAESAEEAMDRAELVGVDTTEWASSLYCHRTAALDDAFDAFVGEYIDEARADYDQLREDARPARYSDWAVAAIHCATDDELDALFDELV